MPEQGLYEKSDEESGNADNNNFHMINTILKQKDLEHAMNSLHKQLGMWTQFLVIGIAAASLYVTIFGVDLLVNQVFHRVIEESNNDINVKISNSIRRMKSEVKGLILQQRFAELLPSILDRGTEDRMSNIIERVSDIMATINDPRIRNKKSDETFEFLYEELLYMALKYYIKNNDELMKYTESMKYVEEAIKIYTLTRKNNVGIAYNLKGFLSYYKERDKSGREVRDFKEAITFFGIARNSSGITKREKLVYDINLATAYDKSGDYTKAIELYTRIIEDYHRKDIYNSRGLAYMERHKSQDDMKRAEKDFRYALDMNNDKALGYLNLSEVQLLQNNYSDSLESSNEALKLQDKLQHEIMSLFYKCVAGSMIEGIKNPNDIKYACNELDTLVKNAEKEKKFEKNVWNFVQIKKWLKKEKKKELLSLKLLGIIDEKINLVEPLLRPKAV